LNDAKVANFTDAGRDFHQLTTVLEKKISVNTKSGTLWFIQVIGMSCGF